MKPFRERSYYELLEVPIGASSEQIRSAYQRALERSAEAGAEAVGSEHLDELRDLLGKAAAVLTDPLQRARYDESLPVAQPRATESLQVGQPKPTAPDADADRQLAMVEMLESREGPRLRPAHRLAYVPLPIQAPQLAEESAIANAEAALVHASRRGEHLRNRPVEIPPDAIFNGDLLRRIRQGRGLAVHEVAERTRISLKHLENIEADRYNQLPATVYLRGILTSLSKELGVDPARVSKDYLQLVSKGKR